MKKKSVAVSASSSPNETSNIAEPHPTSAPALLPERERSLLAAIHRALDEKKAEDLRLLDVVGLSSITDYLVLATGNSEPHLRALRIATEKVLAEAKVPLAGADNSQDSGWIVIDAYQVMVHLFTSENRQKYRLDLLWRDSREVPPAALAPPAPATPGLPPAKPKRTAKKTAVVSMPRKKAAKKRTPRPASEECA